MSVDMIVALGVIAFAGVVYWVHMASYYRGWDDGYDARKRDGGQE